MEVDTTEFRVYNVLKNNLKSVGEVGLHWSVSFETLRVKLAYRVEDGPMRMASVQMKL